VGGVELAESEIVFFVFLINLRDILSRGLVVVGVPLHRITL
jgi:hypothetical protein